MCHTYRALPEEGGVLDQDPYWIKVLAAFESAINEKRALEQHQQRAGQQPR
jgi:hypothetical protein